MNLLLILPAAENPHHIYDRELRACFPQLTVNSVEHHAQVGPFIATADILLSFSPFVADHVVREGGQLKWIQVLGSGTDGVVGLPSLRRDVLITSGHGVQAAPVSEAALSLLLMLSREVPRMVQNQALRNWERWPSQLLHGRTLGILGVGAIGESLARKARALGMRVVGISSAVRTAEGFDRMYAREQLHTAVRELDCLVVLTPYTAKTHHIVDAQVFAQMKPDALLVNIARGGVVNEADLVQALRAKRIRGAALDVFADEPLPADSELWSLPNLIISPHLAGLHAAYPASILPLLRRNIELFLAGRPADMSNIISRH